MPKMKLMYRVPQKGLHRSITYRKTAYVPVTEHSLELNSLNLEQAILRYSVYLITSSFCIV